MSFEQSFGSFFSELRVRSGFKNIRNLAKISGVSASTISRIESDKNSPTLSTLMTLAPYLKTVTEKELLKAAGIFSGGDSVDGINNVDETSLPLMSVKEMIEQLKQGAPLDEVTPTTLKQRKQIIAYLETFFPDSD